MTENALIADRLLLVTQLLEATNGLLRDVALQMRPTALTQAESPARTRRQPRAVAAPRSAPARSPSRRATKTPPLHDEIVSVLRAASQPLTTGEIAERVRSRGRYEPPRRTTPLDATQISSRVGHPKYRRLFSRDGRLISLA